MNAPMRNTAYKHAHKYVYTFELNTGIGTHNCITQMEYTLLTDVTGHKTRYNKAALHTALRIAYGHRPRGVRFRREERVVFV